MKNSKKTIIASLLLLIGIGSFIGMYNFFIHDATQIISSFKIDGITTGARIVSKHSQKIHLKAGKNLEYEDKYYYNYVLGVKYINSYYEAEYHTNDSLENGEIKNLVFKSDYENIKVGDIVPIIYCNKEGGAYYDYPVILKSSVEDASFFELFRWAFARPANPLAILFLLVGIIFLLAGVVMFPK